MQKIIREVDSEKGIMQVTIADERWYLKPLEVGYKAVPSVTWIAGKYPKGTFFYKWLAEKGWDEAEAIKQAAGDKGSKVHSAIVDVILGKEIRIDTQYKNPKTGVMEELTLEECDCILSFVKWKKETNPKSIIWEMTTFNDEDNYAGTIDYICEIDGELWIIDFKTSKSVWTEYELQVNAYKRSMVKGYHGVQALKGKKDYKMGILQVGYKYNKAGYKFTEIEDKYDLFEAAKLIWNNEHGGEKPSKKDYPIVLSEFSKQF